MEFNEKLQELRKQKGLTQEELAEYLYVSRTAISKWESGRGYPNIDSLKAISKFFSVTIDELLSGEEIINIAQEDNRQKEKRFCELVFGAFDLSAVMLLILPLFAEKGDDMIRSVSMLKMADVPPYLSIAYFAIAIGLVIWGVLVLTLRSLRNELWQKSKRTVSLALNVAGVVLFIISLQPYAAVFMFLFLMIKLLLLRKRQ